jgi:hypothetical protein
MTLGTRTPSSAVALATGHFAVEGFFKYYRGPVNMIAGEGARAPNRKMLE